MRVLIACEHTGVVRDAFREKGHTAYSCDLLPDASRSGVGSNFHLQGDIFEVLRNTWREWDLMIAHPPCTFLCSSGMHWTTRGLRDPKLTEDALELVKRLMGVPIPRIAIENPVGCISTRIRPADQYIQPYQFGEDASKKTGLWLKNLPLLVPTLMVPPRLVKGKERWANQCDSGQNKLGPSDDRWAKRSATYPGIAKAMASQWGGL